jgi:hypothetical protein
MLPRCKFVMNIVSNINNFEIGFELIKWPHFGRIDSRDISVTWIFGKPWFINVPINHMLFKWHIMDFRAIKFSMMTVTMLTQKNLVFSRTHPTSIFQKTKMFVIKLTVFQSLQSLLHRQIVQYRILFWLYLVWTSLERYKVQT